jgi:hypothetical protein
LFYVMAGAALKHLCSGNTPVMGFVVAGATLKDFFSAHHAVCCAD